MSAGDVFVVPLCFICTCRYLREFAIMFHDHSLLIFVDDNHHLKIGEPGLPEAAVERGRRVVVGLNRKFQVADHDFTQFSLVPSVTMVCDVPESIQESFFTCVH